MDFVFIVSLEIEPWGLYFDFINLFDLNVNCMFGLENNQITKWQNTIARTKSRTANLSHNSLIPTHVQYKWVSNPALGEFCLTVIGRPNI